MAQLLLTNPAKRRSRKRPGKSVAKARRRTSIARRARGAVATRVKRYRRNPSPRVGNLIETFKEGAIGAVGAVATEIVLSKLPIPENLKSGPMGIAVKAAGSIAIGMIVAKVGKNKKLGSTLAQGGVTVALHDTIRNAVKGPMGLSGMYDAGLLGNDFDDLEYWSPSQSFAPTQPMGYWNMDNDVSEY